MFKFRSPGTYLRSALIYSVLLILASSVLLFTLIDLRYEQIPFKEETDRLPKALIELHHAATQFINVDATEEAFHLNEPTEYLSSFYEKDNALIDAIRDALDNTLVTENELVKLNLVNALDNMTPHRDQFNLIVDLLYRRGTKGFGAIGALSNATKLIEFHTSILNDQSFYNQVLLLEIQVNEYLLYQNDESIKRAVYLFDEFESMLAISEDTKFNLEFYTQLLKGYKESLQVIINIDTRLGLTSTQGELQILVGMGNALEASLIEAATSLTVVVDKSMNSSLLIIIGSLVIIVLIGITFVLQNRAFIATQLAKKKTEETLEFVSNYDANTGLPTQQRYEQIVNTRLKELLTIQNKGLMIALGFKEISDLTKVYGLEGIQQLRTMIADRLTHQCEACLIGIMDGGHFNIFKDGSDAIYDDIHSCEELILSLSAPYTLKDDLIYLTPTLGIATSPEDAIEAIELIEKASIALKSVQSQLGQEMGLYNTSLSDATKERVELVTSMRQAVEKKEFFLVYQPIIDLKTQKIMGTEALIRWIKPSGEFVSPGMFIPIAEETGLIIPISNWVIKESFKQSALWQSKGIDLRISLNLSAVQFTDSTLLTYLEDTLKETGANPHMLSLELTEYSLLNDENGTLEILTAMKKMGFTIYLDDFGTGYSSLSYVHKLPIDTLKVDRTFIKDYPEKKDTTILSVVYELSRQFGMKVVVEGIENEQQHELVKDLGCEYAQGYLYSRPVSVEAVEDLYKKSV